jgi:hypothetical protein
MASNPQQQQSSSMSSPPSPLVWFLLLDSATGLPYKGTTADKVSVSSKADIADFRDAVKAKYADSLLKRIASSELVAYKNKAAFDKRHAAVDDGKEEPLEEDSFLDGLGGTEEEALVVAVPSIKNATDSSVANQHTFTEFLRHGHINRPNDQVLVTIAKRYSQQLQAVLALGRTEPCIDLYETVKLLPSSFTRGVIQKDVGILINGPMSLAQPNILIAVDVKREKHLLIKLLRIPQTTQSQSTLSKKDAIAAEINACTMLSKADILGLVKCDVVEVLVHHSEGLDVSPGVWAALKMNRYTCSLTEVPQLPENCLYNGFSRILKALKAMHELKLAHMDVKSDNLFVNADLRWDLGDFGSTREIGAPVWSYTKVLNPYVIPANATVIPAMDYVLLCVVIAIESQKDQWKNLCGQQQNVQEHLIKERLNAIEDVHFKKEVVELFEENLKIVREHLQRY